MGRPPVSDEVAAEILALRRAGETRAETARQCGVAPGTVRTVERRAGLAPGALRPLAVEPGTPLPYAHLAPPPIAVPPPSASEELPPVDPHTPSLDVIRDAVAVARRDIQQALAIGDRRAAAVANGTLSRLLPVLARAERAASDEGDFIKIRRSDLEAAQAAYRERVSQILAAPLTCTRCGARVRAELAGCDLDVALAAADSKKEET